MYEATVHVEGGGPYEAATADGEATIELWCNDHCDLLAIRGVARERALSCVREGVGVRERLDHADQVLVVTEGCLKRGDTATIEKYLDRHGCLLVPPLRYADGAKRCRVLALDGDSLSAFYRELSGDFPVTVERTREVERATPDVPGSMHAELVPELTSRQREVFTVAHERGYYEIPRGTTTAEIADVVGVDRRTAEEHLRRAEKKLADAAIRSL